MSGSGRGPTAFLRVAASAARTVLGRPAFTSALLAFATLSVFWAACSYRLYLARYHTEVGIPGTAPWWGYILENAQRIAAGQELGYRLYAPGQSYAVYLIGELFSLDPGIVRIVLGLLDGLAAMALTLLAWRLFGRAVGLTAGAIYALWPEAATLSVNILHDHSPQPLLLFAGLAVVTLWFKNHRIWCLAAGGFLLGLVPLFRTDAVLATLFLPIGMLPAFRRHHREWKRAILRSGILFAATLIPSLPYDLHNYAKTGRFVHIAAGDPWSSVFIRYGREGGFAGTRQADLEVAFLSGVGQPFGYEWENPERFRILARFGRRLFLADPWRYIRLVLSTSWPHLTTPPAHLLWGNLPPSVALGDLTLALPLGNPEWPMMVLLAKSGLQSLLANRLWLLLAAAAGLAVGWADNRDATLALGLVMVGWTATLVALVPESRYLTMPFSLAPLFAAVGLCGIIRIVWRTAASLRRNPSTAPERGLR